MQWASAAVSFVCTGKSSISPKPKLLDISEHLEAAMAKRYRHSYPDISPLVAEALKNNDLYRDGEPDWTNGETSLEATVEWERRYHFFKKHGRREPTVALIADRLSECSPEKRCLSGACPPCGRAFQRFFVGEGKRLLEAEAPGLIGVSAVSLVLAPLLPEGQLGQLSIKPLHDSVKKVLRANGVKLALGGLDLSFNEHREHRFKPHWAPQLWLLVPASNRHRWEPALRAMCLASDVVPRPLKLLRWDMDLAALGYALKTRFQRRVSYEHERPYGDGTRACRNTRSLPLRAKERLELYRFLDQAGLAARVLLLGARPTRTEAGISIVRLTKRENQ
jgi:hypothetical protein